MKAIDLLEKYPESCKIIQEWFTNQLSNIPAVKTGGARSTRVQQTCRFDQAA